jgi:hypothetical protein
VSWCSNREIGDYRLSLATNSWIYRPTPVSYSYSTECSLRHTTCSELTRPLPDRSYIDIIDVNRSSFIFWLYIICPISLSSDDSPAIFADSHTPVRILRCPIDTDTSYLHYICLGRTCDIELLSRRDGSDTDIA